MTRHQQIAISNPCRFAFETANPLFGHLVGESSVVLTVNSGYE